jgi:hypothetical protein
VSALTTPLYELTAYKRELEALADSGDVPPEQILDTLNALEGDIRDKAIAVAAFTLNLEVTAKAIREAAAAMLERAKRIDGRAESIRAYALFNLQAAGISKIESPWFTLAVRKNPPSVVVDDEAAIPREYFVTPEPPPPKLDKAALKRAISAGTEVAGAHLTQTERLEIK